MARTLRSNLPDGIYHVTGRAVHEGWLFTCDEDRRHFVRLLTQVGARFGWRVHAFCLMGRHYRLIVETTRVKLSAGFHRLNGTYAQAFNRRYERKGTCLATGSQLG